LAAVGGIEFASGSTLSGHGTVDASVSGLGTINATGNLTLGKASSASGYNYGGTLNVGANTVTLLDADAAMVSTTSLAGGRLVGANGIFIVAGKTLSGFGTVDADVSGLGTITANGSLTLGRGTSVTGFNFDGTLNVGANTVTLNAVGAAKVGTTKLSGGAVVAGNGIMVPGDRTLSGFGRVDGCVSGSGTITATGNLMLGSNTSSDGVAYTGTLNVGSKAVTLLDADVAALGGTTLSGGRLIAVNGIAFSGSTVSGYGVIQGKITGAALAPTSSLIVSTPLDVGNTDAVLLA